MTLNDMIIVGSGLCHIFASSINSVMPLVFRMLDNLVFLSPANYTIMRLEKRSLQVTHW